MEGEKFAYGTIAIATEATKVFLDLLKYLAENARFELEMRHYSENYAEVLRHPDQYAVFHITGDLQNADELKAMLVKAGMDPDQFIQFDDNDQLLCVRKGNREQFLACLKDLQEMDPDAFQLDDELSTPGDSWGQEFVDAESEPEVPRIESRNPKYIVDRNGNFCAVTDKDGHALPDDEQPVIEMRDSYGLTLKSHQMMGDQHKADMMQGFAGNHDGVYVRTPNGNMIHEDAVYEDGSYDAKDVILVRDDSGCAHFENGMTELGSKCTGVLKNVQGMSFKAVRGGFVSRQAEGVYIPAIDPTTGDYFDFPSGQVVLSPYTLPSRTDPNYERICENRRQAVLQRADALADHMELFYLNDDGNMTTSNPHPIDGRSFGEKFKDAAKEAGRDFLHGPETLLPKPEASEFVVLLPDEFGSYRLDGEHHEGILQDTSEQEEDLGEEHADSKEEAASTDEEKEDGEEEEKQGEGKESPDEEPETDEEQENNSAKDDKKKEKKKTKRRAKDYRQERADEPAASSHSEPDTYQEPESTNTEPESVATTPDISPAPDLAAAEAVVTGTAAEAVSEVSQEPAYAEAASAAKEPAYTENTPEQAQDLGEAQRQEENKQTAQRNEEAAKEEASAREAERHAKEQAAEERAQADARSYESEAAATPDNNAPASESYTQTPASESYAQTSPSESYKQTAPEYGSSAAEQYASRSAAEEAQRQQENAQTAQRNEEATQASMREAEQYERAQKAAEYEQSSASSQPAYSHTSAPQPSAYEAGKSEGSANSYSGYEKQPKEDEYGSGSSNGYTENPYQRDNYAYQPHPQPAYQNTSSPSGSPAAGYQPQTASKLQPSPLPAYGAPIHAPATRQDGQVTTQHDGQQGGIGTRSKNLDAIHGANGTNPAKTPLVGHDTRVQTNFLSQRKIFGAEEIRVAGSSQRMGLGQAVNTQRLGQSFWHMYSSLGKEAQGSDNTTKLARDAASWGMLAYQMTYLRDGNTARSLQNISMNKAAALYGSGKFDGLNRFMKRNGLQEFGKDTFVGGKQTIRKAYDDRSRDLVNTLKRGGYLKKDASGMYVLKDPHAVAAMLFGKDPTSEQVKFIKQMLSNQQASQQYMRNPKRARTALAQKFISVASHQDETIKTMHESYHMVQAGVQTYTLLKNAVVADFKFTHSMYGIQGRFDRHQKKFNKLKNQSTSTSKEFKKNVKNFKEKSHAELKRMNKAQVQEYKRLREAHRQQEWMSSHGARLQASKARSEKINVMKQKIKNFNDMPANFAKKQGRRVANWAKQTKPGKMVTGAVGKITGVKKHFTSWASNTKVGKLFTSLNQFGNRLRELINQALNAIKHFLIKCLLIYVGTIILVGLFVLFIVMPLSTNLSMFTDDAKSMVDEASSAASISGKVYSELRYMEIQWASDIRAYGTQENPIVINNSDEHSLRFTDRKLTAEEYLNSEEGIKDLLGAYANEDGKTDEKHSGVQGPAPFAGAKLDDYKVIKQVDGGNVLEIEGKPQEGWTSNSKEIIAMATVFYSQCIDEVTTDTADSVNAWNSFWDTAETAFHRIGTYFEATGFPLLGWIAGGTDWSYSGLYRNYAYPLALNSHLENYYLSTYIYPTKWTAPELADGNEEDTDDDDDASNNATSASHAKSEEHSDARYDTDQEHKSAEPGDVLLNKQWGIARNTESKHGKLGIGKNGGTGKVDSKNQVSKGLWGSLGDDNYQGFETCSDAIGNAEDRDIYHGYGCMLRYRFSFKWNGSFGTDEDGNILDKAAVEASGLNTLHYGEADAWNEPNEGDGEGEDENNNNVEYNKTGGDVSADVSPFYKNDDVARGYQKNDCLVYPLKLTAIAWSCWEETGTTEINMTEGGGYYPEWVLWQKQFDDRNRQKHFTHDDSEWAIDKIVTTGEGFDVYSFRIPRDEDGNILFNEPTDATIFHLRHNCTGKHQGIYCGGHAQLRTRGMVYGLSKEQVTDQVLDEDEHSLYDPKYLDPDSNGKDAEWYGDALTVRNEPIAEFDAASMPAIEGSTILDEDAKYVKDARDLYDIDVLITRPKEMYPQTAETAPRTIVKRTAETLLSLNPFVSTSIFIWDKISDAPKSTEMSETTTNTEPWKSWTLTNMSQVTEMINQNWHDMYQVVDTQTLVGGQDGVNSLDDDMMNNVLDQLGWNAIDNSIDYGNPVEIANLIKKREGKNAVVNGKELSISEEMEYVNRLRHLKYALSLVGKAGYSQDEHDKLWGNLSGHLTDCSGYVSNVWRDALGLTGTTGAMATSGLKAYAGSALHEFTGPDCGVEPGDIILKNPDDIGGSAHALIYVGNLDSSKLYLDREATNADGDEYQFYNDDGSLKYSGEGSVQVYALDCSSMTITTDTYAENSPNTLKEFLTKPSWDTFKGLVNQNNKEPGGAARKARSGNIRFSAKSYLNDNSAGYELYYIDMNQLGYDKGVYSTGSNGGLNSIYGTFFNDFASYQSEDKAANAGADTIPSANENGFSFDGKNFAEATANFWEKDTSLGTELNKRKTVAISSAQGEEEKKADDWEITDPPVPSDPEVDSDQDYDDFDWQDYADKLPEGEFKDQLKALIDYYGESQWAKYYASGLITIKKTSDGKLVFYEEQASKWNGKTIAYGTAVAGSDPTNTVARRGCFLYALAAAMTAKTGKIYTVQEVITECGGTLTWNKNGTLNMSGLDRVGGDINKLVANAQNAGLDANYYGHTNVSLSKIDKGLQEGKVYCVWSTTESDPKATLHSPNGAGMHWTTILGRTSSGNYIVACNGGRGMEISPSQMPKYFVSYAEIG